MISAQYDVIEPVVCVVPFCPLTLQGAARTCARGTSWWLVVVIQGHQTEEGGKRRDGGRRKKKKKKKDMRTWLSYF